MCGIIGYTGCDKAVPILLEGLKNLEYRGYDSAGVAVQTADGIRMIKATGKVENLAAKAESTLGLYGVCGIGHTRWATHGSPSDVNAHPHMSADGRFAIVHNGIIENYLELKKDLEKKGVEFKSETDTEVIVQLLAYYYDGDVRKSLMRTVARLTGSYAVAVICADCPGVVYAARMSSPLIVGVGAGENYFASDITALIRHTKDVIDLDDGETAEISMDGVRIFNRYGRPVEKKLRHILWDIAAAEKGGYPHFMLKEIMEQPQAIKATIEPRIKNGRVELDDLDIDMSAFDRVLITACGSAYHAGCVGRLVIETLCRIPVEAEVASEFRYRNAVMSEKTLVIAISQSGETADTIAAMREAKKNGATVLAIVNVVGSTIAKLADHVIYTWAGPEIAVATTKGYVTQLVVLDLFAVWAAERLGRLGGEEYDGLIRSIKALPSKAQRALDLSGGAKELAKIYHDRSSMFFIGRNLDYAVAMEGSLKLKEISYLHSEAYAAGELKHGTIALIEPGRLVAALCCCDRLYEKTASNIQQVKARGAKVLALAPESNRAIYGEADYVIQVPDVHPLLFPAVEIIPMQLFAYCVALENGCDIDKPKNLAKSVTVE
ncbi:MAG: glutamine--fructose-6-phosphate transaminase (isomerizing) [Clostridia bacterium]|nr:glutamine--fructose-6-phosphate transaminase (isomerizing) [Clostridia bacterium]